MKRGIIGFLFFALFLQLLSCNVFADRDLLMERYNSARHIQTSMRKRVNWAVELIGQKGQKAFNELNIFNRESGIDIFVYDPLEKRMVVRPIYMSIVKGELDLYPEINPEFYAKEIIKMEIRRMNSGYLDKVTSFFAPFELNNHYAKLALAPSGKTYIVSTGSTNMDVEKQFIVSLVSNAVKLIESEGIDNALKAFHTEGSKYNQKDTYIYVLTDKGVYLSNPNYPEIIGKDMYNYAGYDGSYPVRKMLQVASEPPYSGWIFTRSLRPEDSLSGDRIKMDEAGKGLKDKISFLKKVTIGEKAYIVGSGLYLENMNKQ